MKLSDYTPLGMNIKLIKTLFLILLILSFIFSLQFFFSYSSWFRGMVILENRGQIITEDLKAYCSAFMENCFSLFPVGAVCSLLLGIYSYAYLFSGAKSIYTLKRIPNKNEVFKRVFLLPILGVLVFLVAGLLLIFIYYSYFVLKTPKHWQALGQLEDLRRNLKWLI